MAKSNLFSRLIGSKKAAPEAEPVVVAKTSDNPDLTNAVAGRSRGDGLKVEDNSSNSPGLKDLPTDTPSGGQGGTLPFGKEPPAGLANRVAPGGNSAVDEADQAAADALAAFSNRKADLLDQLGGNLGADNDPNNRTPEINDGKPSADRPSLEDLFGTTTTGEDAAAADAVGQVLGGFGNLTSPGSFQNDPFIAASIALVDEQANSAATGPSVAADGSPLKTAVDSVTQADRDAQAKALGITPPSAAPAAPAPDAAPAPAPPAEEPGIIDSIISFFKSAEVGSNVNAAAQLKEVDDGVGAPVGSTTVSGALKQQDIKNLETAIGDVIGGIAGSGKKDGGGVKDPGPDGDLLGGPPTEAEIAFRLATQNALGIRRIPGDIDPDENAQTGPVDPNALAAAIGKTSNESLVGQPGGQEISSGGAVQGGPSAGNPQGTNIDPIEGDAFTGPSRGGNPSDLEFGNGPLLGLDDASAADEEEEDSSSSSEEEEDDTTTASNTDD